MSAYKFSFPPTHPGDHDEVKIKSVLENKTPNKPKGGERCSSFCFVFFSLFFLLTGFLVSPGMVRIGVGRFFLEGLINAKDRIYQELQDFYPGSFEPVAKREDDPLGTYFCS